MPLGPNARRPSFEQLYADHFEFVWRTLVRFGVPESDVADAAQDVFVVVHRRLPEFEPQARVTTWLYSICLHAARDRRRRAHVRREVLGRSVDVADARAGASEQLERKDDFELFEIALQGMNFEQRAVFVLFELEGLRGEDIAVMLALPLGTVYSRLRLARAAFRRGAVRAAARRAQPTRVQTPARPQSGAYTEEEDG